MGGADSAGAGCRKRCVGNRATDRDHGKPAGHRTGQPDRGLMTGPTSMIPGGPMISIKAGPVDGPFSLSKSVSQTVVCDTGRLWKHHNMPFSS